MSKTFLQIQNQIEKLQKEADLLRAKEASGVLTRIKEAIAIYGFTAADLGVAEVRSKTATSQQGTPLKRMRKKAAPAPKFSDGKGNIWGGRGPRPRWFKAAIAAGRTPDELKT